MKNHALRAAFVAALVCWIPLANAAKPGGGTTSSGYTARNLGVLLGDAYSRAWGVSDAGSVVGESVHFVPVDDGQMAFRRAVYWSPGFEMLPLPTKTAAGGAERQSKALAIAVGATGELVVGQEDPAGPHPHAVIWKGAPSNEAVALEDDLSNPSSAAGVNEDGIAVGHWGASAAIWVADASETDGYKRTDFKFDSGTYTEAKDVNRQGVVVGYSDPGDMSAPKAFVRFADGTLYPLSPLDTDAYTGAYAVSDVFAATVGGLAVDFVYVAGWTQSVTRVQRAVRWKVDVGTGVVVEKTLLTQASANGVNDAGDVLCGSGQGAKLFRGNAYYSLRPPKGASGVGALALAGTASSTTYVAGYSWGQKAASERAVVWTIK